LAWAAPEKRSPTGEALVDLFRLGSVTLAGALPRVLHSRVIGTGRTADGRLTSNVGAVRPLAEAPAAFGRDAPRVSGKTIIRVTEGW
jgi:hypothetical protein